MQGLGIKIGNEWLELRPGTVLEIERNNSFLQFGDSIVGDYSMPTEIDNTPRNDRLINYAGFIQKKMDTAGIDVRIFSNGNQHSIAKLKIEKPSHNLNKVSDGSTSIYFLAGVSNFYQDIKKLRLKDINVGGLRTFGNDAFNVNGAGFWGHIHSVINAAPGYGTSGYDYTFFPSKNVDFLSSGTVNDASVAGLLWIMNGVSLVNGNPQFTAYFANGDYKFLNPICPYPYLKYVMMKAAEFAGWQMTGSALDDPDFKKIVLWNQRSIKWGYAKAVGGLNPHIDWKMYPQVKFDLQNFLPDVTIAEFLLAIKNRLGLTYEFDRVSKTINVKFLKDVITTSVKSLTKYTSPVVIKSVATENKEYALRDTENGGPFNTANADYHGAVNKLSDLPAAAEALVDQIYLVATENNLYICTQNETTTNWFWELLTPNLGGVGPDDAQETITTAALTAPSTRNDNYYDMIPRRDEEGARDQIDEDVVFTSIVLLFNHGIQQNAAGQKIPFGNHHVYTSAGVKVGNWSLAYKAQLFDGTQVGLYDAFWKKVLDTLTDPETFTVVLNLPWVEYLKLQFGDVLNIANVNMYLTKIKEQIPYSGSVEIEAVRS